ncbi:MAG: tRNA (5-methylaminomethyl-2-thiouridine)(34)-methyltransferase MnmD [Marinilabiliales bacterium]
MSMGIEDFQLVITEDGSHTLYNRKINESYHSRFGAITESKYIFIDNGLKSLKDNKINVLEIGFGTGLNAYLTCLYAIDKKLSINYTAVEKYPLQFDIFNKLNYSDILKKDKSLFTKLHLSPYNARYFFNSNFWLYKLHVDINDMHLTENYHLVYFDAFSPDIQPELWTETVFSNIYNNMMKNGILITYSAKGKVRRVLKSVGFIIETLPGPPGKREITKAIKK